MKEIFIADKMINVVIVDYGLGNLFSLEQACKHFGYNPIISSDPEIILKADRLILPGVGAFGSAMERLRLNDLIEPLKDFVSSGKLLLGICLGMQLLFENSEEHGVNNGLGFIKGRILKFPKSTKSGEKLLIPSIGWNKVHFYSNTLINSPFERIKNNDFMYFIHSYYAKPDNENEILAITDYHEFTYCSAVRKGNIYGFQFHPEKSGEAGLILLDDFLSHNY